MGSAEIISRKDAIAFLDKPQSSVRTLLMWNGENFGKGVKRKLPRHPRGGGPAVDYVNYGMRNANNKLVAVLRIAPTPYGNAPAISAVGSEAAPYTAYLSRLMAVGISTEDLVLFVKSCVNRLHKDLARNGRDIRYLLSLDDPEGRLIETSFAILSESQGAAGKTYISAGALNAGQTRKRKQAIRYITPEGDIRSIYQSGKNISAAAVGLPQITEGIKHRFVWVLADPLTPEYKIWRSALPTHIKTPIWGDDGLGWIQPRLLTGEKLCFN